MYTLSICKTDLQQHTGHWGTVMKLVFFFFLFSVRVTLVGFISLALTECWELWEVIQTCGCVPWYTCDVDHSPPPPPPPHHYVLILQKNRRDVVGTESISNFYNMCTSRLYLAPTFASYALYKTWTSVAIHVIMGGGKLPTTPSSPSSDPDNPHLLLTPTHPHLLLTPTHPHLLLTPTHPHLLLTPTTLISFWPQHTLISFWPRHTLISFWPRHTLMSFWPRHILVSFWPRHTLISFWPTLKSNFTNNF